MLPELLESLEQDQVKMADVYDKLAIRYRQEPYRLKLAYIQRRLENAYDRSLRMYEGDPYPDPITEEQGAAPIYRYGYEFLRDLRLIQRNLEATGLHCQDLDTLICQVEIFGFTLAQLDLRQESSVHSDALDEITQYLEILPQPYSEMSEADKAAWLVSELKTPSSAHSWGVAFLRSHPRNGRNPAHGAEAPPGIWSRHLLQLRHQHEPPRQ